MEDRVAALGRSGSWPDIIGDDDEPPVRFASIDLTTLTDEQLRTLNAIVWQLEQPSDRSGDELGAA